MKTDGLPSGKKADIDMNGDKNLRSVKKNDVLTTLVFVTVILNILALAFTVVRGRIQFLSGSESYFANGFTLVFDGYPAIVEGCGNTLRVCLSLYFGLSVLLALSIAVLCLVKRSFDFGRFGLFAVIASLILSVLYMVFGIVAYSVASDYARLYYECSTAAFWPFVLSALLSISYFWAKYRMPDQVELYREMR